MGPKEETVSYAESIKESKGRRILRKAREDKRRTRCVVPLFYTLFPVLEGSSQVIAFLSPKSNGPKERIVSCAESIKESKG